MLIDIIILLGNIDNDSQSFADDSFGTAEQNSNDKNAELNAVSQPLVHILVSFFVNSVMRWD